MTASTDSADTLKGGGRIDMSRAAMQMAAEFIEAHADQWDGQGASPAAICAALRAALAEQDDDLTAAAAEERKRAEQSQPLTDEEILSAVGWERAETYMQLLPNFPANEAKQETLKNARAVEAEVLRRMGVQR